MTGFSATDAAFTGFRIVRERPKAAIFWAMAQMVVSLIVSASLAGSAGSALMQIQALSPEARQDPAQALPLLHQLLPFYGVLLLVALILYPVLYAAMNRAVLRPADDRFGYLRIGADEFRQLGLFVMFILLGIAFEIIVLIAVFVIAVVVGLIGKAAMPFALMLIYLGLAGSCAFIAVRMSLASAQTFASGRINLFGSWKLTRGQFWPMLGAYALALALVVVVALLAYIVIFAIVAAMVGLPAAATLVARADMSSLSSYLSPPRLVMLVLGSFVSALVWPLFVTPSAAIYQSLAVTPKA